MPIDRFLTVPERCAAFKRKHNDITRTLRYDSRRAESPGFATQFPWPNRLLDFRMSEWIRVTYSTSNLRSLMDWSQFRNDWSQMICSQILLGQAKFVNSRPETCHESSSSPLRSHTSPTSERVSRSPANFDLHGVIESVQ